MTSIELRATENVRLGLVDLCTSSSRWQLTNAQLAGTECPAADSQLKASGGIRCERLGRLLEQHVSRRARVDPNIYVGGIPHIACQPQNIGQQKRAR